MGCGVSSEVAPAMTPSQQEEQRRLQEQAASQEFIEPTRTSSPDDSRLALTTRFADQCLASASRMLADAKWICLCVPEMSSSPLVFGIEATTPQSSNYWWLHTTLDAHLDNPWHLRHWQSRLGDADIVARKHRTQRRYLFTTKFFDWLCKSEFDDFHTAADETEAAALRLATPTTPFSAIVPSSVASTSECGLQGLCVPSEQVD